MNEELLDTLYLEYGFQKLPISVVGVCAYVLPSGYFLNADIVPIVQNADINAAKEYLEKAGYACTTRPYNSIEEAEIQLFSGFFAAESSRHRLKQEYERFARNVSETLGVDGTYNYIEGNYESDAPRTSGKLIEHLLQLLKGPGATLVILEAAAGFGKTCTAYEILKSLLEKEKNQVPILTEFSLSREARIFRHVLLDEINRSFPGLKLELVQEQVRKGRTPLILDGFDELLSASATGDTRFEDAEPMLETIGQLLNGEAKILLTTRSTAIFSQREFEIWRNQRLDKCDVYRVRLARPTLKEWLGNERLKKIKDAHLPIEDLSNPVLLAFLRYADESHFEELCSRPNELVEKYFNALLDREVRRQDLRMSIDDQLVVFRTLAAEMVRNTVTSEDREYIQLRIEDAHNKLLQQVRSKYSSNEKPTIEELSSKLANHALLDRRTIGKQQVGFINDFILGTLVGDAICRSMVSPMQSRDPALFTDLAATAYAVQGDSERLELWNRMADIIELIDPTQQVAYDLALIRKISRSLSDATIVGLIIENCIIGVNSIRETAFVDCCFRNVTIKASNLDNVNFIGCTFYNCTAYGGSVGRVWISNCSGDDSLATLEQLLLQTEGNESEERETVEGAERTVLENFWPRGRSNAKSTLAIRTLYLGHPKSDYPNVTSAIERLKKRGLIIIEGEQAKLPNDQIARVAKILDRDISGMNAL